MSKSSDQFTFVKRQATWKYILWGMFAFPFACLLYIALDSRVLHPELTNQFYVETAMDKLRWFGIPLLAVVAIVGAKWLLDSYTAIGREREWSQKAQQLEQEQADAQNSKKAQREYVLEVLGLGVTVEKYRQGKLWNVLRQGGAFSSIREPDPEKYPWAAFDKDGQSGGRSCDSLENGAEPSPMFWGVPTLYASGPIEDPAIQPTAISPMEGLAGSAPSTGMAWHLFVTGPWELGERPDRLLEQAFKLFDMYPDLPYLVLLASDNETLRDASAAPNTPSRVKDGHYIPEMSDASAVFVLARRERVEPLRPYVWDDPDNDYLQENLRRMYYQVKEDVPTPEKLANTEEFHGYRQPTIAEWLPAAAAFAKRPVYDKKDGSLIDAFKRWANHPPKDWKPTPWFPIPWNRNQMEAFDSLPSMGFIHRPVFVKFEDEEGRPVTRRDAWQKILEAGWQEALQTLSDEERAQGPARIIAAYGKNVDQQIALEGVLRQYAAQGGPEIDSGKTSQFIDVDRRMGNTGAATFFVQMAVGVMGSYIEGGPSAAINLRDPAGASIVFVSPPRQEPGRAQPRPDVFRHRVEPAIDPRNYEPPTFGDVFGHASTPPAADSPAKH